MTAFLAKFDGTDAAVSAALKEDGADEAVAGDQGRDHRPDLQRLLVMR